ncbi:MAG: metal-sensitive transcriptional regulator [Akkermansiaceae bacterium]|nr:metal-sensitive transcriptional regulator [Akkermansiaceae bacterium]
MTKQDHQHVDICHRDQLTRLSRIAGQVGGISRMIEEGRYCVDILIQLRAVRAALKKVESNVLRKHMQHCVAQALGNGEEALAKVEELVHLFETEQD